MAKIYLQRHTHPDIDPKICYGASDIDVRSEFESVDLPPVLRIIEGAQISKSTKVYCSPLVRCRKLATEITRREGLCQPTYDERLREISFGDWEMRPWSEIHSSEEGLKWFSNFLYERVPGGESFIDLLGRAKSFLSEIDSVSSDTLIVTHGGFMRAVLVAFELVEIDQIFTTDIVYAELIEIEIEGDKRRWRRVN
ncbi:MAG: histidine phosphatase family protein [Rikenellaceae bacterium]